MYRGRFQGDQTCGGERAGSDQLRGVRNVIKCDTIQALHIIIYDVQRVIHDMYGLAENELNAVDSCHCSYDVKAWICR